MAGFGRKKHMTRGRLLDETENASLKTKSKADRIAIVGDGIAGLSLAYAFF